MAHCLPHESVAGCHLEGLPRDERPYVLHAQRAADAALPAGPVLPAHGRVELTHMLPAVGRWEHYEPPMVVFYERLKGRRVRGHLTRRAGATPGPLVRAYMPIYVASPPPCVHPKCHA